MKKRKIFALMGLGFLALGGIALGTVHNSYHGLAAEGEQVTEPEPDPDPVEETFECKVTLGETKHGKVTVDKNEGHVGDLVTINADADLFYLVKSITVNGTALVEDENVRGKFTFALAEGENVIAVKFEIDAEMLGAFSDMVEEATNGDWANFFSVKNVITILSWILNGGLLIAIIRYYVKDKKLEKNLEKTTKETVRQVISEEMKSNILDILKEWFTPIFKQVESDIVNIGEACTVLCRCFALMQENTPESRIAITKELSSLKLGDKTSITMIEARIQEFIDDQKVRENKILDQLKQIQVENKEIVAGDQNDNLKLSDENPEDNGTQATD